MVAEEETPTPIIGADEPQGMDLNEVPSEAVAPAEAATEMGDGDEDDDDEIDWEEG